MKYLIAIVAALVLLGGGAYYFLNSNTSDYESNQPEPEVKNPDSVVEDADVNDETSLPEIEKVERSSVEAIGQSIEGEDIIAYHFGNGNKEVLLVGGAHGSYSKNTTALAQEAVSYFQDNEDKIPEGVSLTIIPTLNPDGLNLSGTAGRFNANDVDLNRNFDCEWSATATWRSQQVSGGDTAFSEPEAAALRDYIYKYDPTAAVVYFSAEGKVYPSACGGSPDNASVNLAATYATAAGYPAEAEFDAYAITGDMVNWMAKEGIPAISVLLSDHENAEWGKNLKGIEAVLNSLK